MLRTTFALAAGALALLLVSSAFDSAEAQRRSGARALHGGSTARGFSGRAFRAPRIHAGRSLGGRRFTGRHIPRHRSGRHIRRGIIVGVPLGVYGAYAYSNSCDWLYRKAVITGSRYWWYRYEECLDSGY